MEDQIDDLTLECINYNTTLFCAFSVDDAAAYIDQLVAAPKKKLDLLKDTKDTVAVKLYIYIYILYIGY